MNDDVTKRIVNVSAKPDAVWACVYRPIIVYAAVRLSKLRQKMRWKRMRKAALSVYV